MISGKLNQMWIQAKSQSSDWFGYPKMVPKKGHGSFMSVVTCSNYLL